MSSNRNKYFDFLRGLAIIMVVGIHTFRGADFESLSGCVSVVIRSILNCAVPLFLAISGFFMAGKEVVHKWQRHAFWSHQIPKVYIPALIWGLPWLAMAILGGENPVISVVLWVFCGLSIFYYIALIIQYYLLLPVIQRVTPPHNHHYLRIISDSDLGDLRKKTVLLFATTAAVSFVCVAVVTWIKYFRGIDLPLIVYAGPFPLWIMFFVLGVVLSQTNRDYKLLWILLLLFMSLALQFFEARFLNGVLGSSSYGIKPSSFLFSALIILLCFSKKMEHFVGDGGKVFGVITWIGSLSFAIYLTHCLWIMALPHVINIESWPLFWCVILICDILFVWLLKRVIPSKYSKYLGI